MAATVAQIRGALATALDTISGLRASATIPDQMPVPMAVIGGPEVEYHFSYASGVATYTFPIRIYTSQASVRAGQELLDTYIGPAGASSVRVTLEADGTLGGVVHTTTVKGVSGYGSYTIGDAQYLGAEWSVEVVG